MFPDRFEGVRIEDSWAPTRLGKVLKALGLEPPVTVESVKAAYKKAYKSVKD